MVTREGEPLNKITKALAGTAVAVPLALGGNVAGANAAEALTVTSYNSSRCIGSSLWAVTSYRYDYNWLEELQGKKDYWVTYYRYRIAYNHPACTGEIYPV